MTKQKLAIIGTGISGLGLASIVHPSYEISVFERQDRLGGHSRTISVDTGKEHVPVDTGFIVFNKRTYPLLTALFEHLDVPLVQSDMSFGVTVKKGWLEYCTTIPFGFIAQKRNLLRPKFWRLIIDLLRFDSLAAPYIKTSENKTLKECLDEMPLGSWFKKYFVFAMGGAIWSMPTETVRSYPARAFLQFFQNHSLLSINGRPKWFSVRGGSQVYVHRIAKPFKDRIELNADIISVKRMPDHVLVRDAKGQAYKFDQVAFACHSDQALAMIEDPTTDEKDVLGRLRYGANSAVTHFDIDFMPKRRKAWASWIFQSSEKVDDKNNPQQAISLSYWMNNLQKFKSSRNVFVSLNPGRRPAEELVVDEKEFNHPQFDLAALDAQGRLSDIQGEDRLWFCGAYFGYGFHEDGLRSAVQLAERLGCKAVWAPKTSDSETHVSG